MCSSMHIVATLLLVVTALSYALPKPKQIGHHLVKRSLELRYGSMGDCQEASQEIYDCSRTMGNNMPATTDPLFQQKLCRQIKTFYDCGVGATKKCNDVTLQTALDRLKSDGHYTCPSEFGPAQPWYWSHVAGQMKTDVVYLPWRRCKCTEVMWPHKI